MAVAECCAQGLPVTDACHAADDVPAVMAGLTRDKQSEQWQTPRFIPHPATWLNGRCWEDGPESSGGETPPAADRPFVC